MNWRDHDTAASHMVASTDVAGLDLHVRARGDDPDRAPVLFVHGATYASRLYDIPAPGASWMADLADAGFAAYALDVRGYGRSRMPSLPDAPFARAAQALRDIADVTAWIRARHGGARLHLIGGSWGSITGAMFAGGPGAGDVDRLVLYAPIFGARNDGWRRMLADPADPGRLAGWGPTRPVTEAATRARWDAEMPAGADWRDEATFRALVDASLADDPDAARRDPPAFAAPNGTFLDLWEAMNGRPSYDPARIARPTLLIRGGADPTSTRADALALFDRLGTPDRHYVEIAGGAHFVSAERRAPEVFAAVRAFLGRRGRSVARGPTS